MPYADRRPFELSSASRNRRLYSSALICCLGALTLMPVGVSASQLQNAQVTVPKAGGGSTDADKQAKPDKKARKAKPGSQFEGKMTLARIDEIVRRLDENAKEARPGTWQLTINDRPVIIVTDQLNNRLRTISPITKTEGMPEDLLKRLMQANFDTALDARYAIAKGLLWSTYIHPLRALHDRQFIRAIGQTVNLALSFGTTFSSGGMTFGGGDSRDIIRKQLIEKLLKKGLPI